MAGAALQPGNTVMVVRAKLPGGDSRTLKIPILQQDVIDPHADIAVWPGDRLLVVSPPPSNERAKGEYYIGGKMVARAGAYSIEGRRIDVKQAMMAAGFQPESSKAYVSVIRRDGGTESFPFRNVRYADLISLKQADLYVHDNDMIYVTDDPLPDIKAATTQSAPRQ